MNYYTINEETVRRAKEANSFSDYVPGSATAEYRAMVDKAHELGERQKERIDPMYHEKIDHLVDRYARKLADNFNERNAIDARVPSIMIAGGSNFPVRKKEKQNAARDRNMGSAGLAWAGSARTIRWRWKNWKRSWRACRKIRLL